MGATIIGVTYDGGVVLGADSRTSTGKFSRFNRSKTFLFCVSRLLDNDANRMSTYDVLDRIGGLIFFMEITIKIMLLDILSMFSDVGDKALVFSQSIPTLDLIEQYLSKLPRHEKKWKSWKKGEEWYRLDGKTEASERQKLVERFNEPRNKRVRQKGTPQGSYSSDKVMESLLGRHYPRD